MRKFFGYILSPFVIIAFFLVLLIFQPVQWVCYKFFGYAAHKWSVDTLNLCLLSTVYLAGNRVIFINKQNLPLGRPVIFLANHQSMFDIPPLIYYLHKYHAKFISKIELTKGIPSISFNLKYGGGANIDRKDSRQSVAEIVKLALRMKENKWSTVNISRRNKIERWKSKILPGWRDSHHPKKMPRSIAGAYRHQQHMENNAIWLLPFEYLFTHDLGSA